MASRRDQLQSYQFLNQRVISALVMRETDPAQSPLRRGIGALFAGAMVLLLVAVGFGVYGLITKIGNREWQTDGKVVIEKETGAAFVYEAETEMLHPMLNYTSALLASKKNPPEVVKVARKGLIDVRRGPTWGIPKAPPTVPAAETLLKREWALCTVPDRDEAGNPTAVTLASVGAEVKEAKDLDVDSAILVRVEGTTYLVWHGHRFEIRSPEVVVRSLFGEQRRSIEVGSAWLNGLLLGQAIEPIEVPKSGNQARYLPGRRIGDLLVAQTGSGPQYYLVLESSLALLTDTQHSIYVGTTPNVSTTPIAVTQIAGLTITQLAGSDPDANPPASTPKLRELDLDDAICAFSSYTGTPRLTVGGKVRDDLSTSSHTGAAGGGSELADEVLVPSGQAALVRVMLGTGGTSGGFALVTDAGLRYPLGAAALGYLGLKEKDAIGMPSALVLAIPAGPTLDPVAARRSINMTALPVTGN